MITLYEKAAAIAIVLERIERDLIIRPGEILRRASAEEIDFYYEKLCKERNC